MSGSDRGGGRSSYREALKEAGPYLTLGIELGLTMIIWSGLGYLLDIWLNTLPWLTLLGVGVGMVSLFIQILRAAKRTEESSRRKRPKS